MSENTSSTVQNKNTVRGTKITLAFYNIYRSYKNYEGSLDSVTKLNTCKDPVDQDIYQHQRDNDAVSLHGNSGISQGEEKTRNSTEFPENQHRMKFTEAPLEGMGKTVYLIFY